MKQANTVFSNTLLEESIRAALAAHKDFGIVLELLTESLRGDQSERVRILSKYKTQEETAYQATLQMLKGRIGVLFFSTVRSELEPLLGSKHLMLLDPMVHYGKSRTLREHLVDALGRVLSGELPEKCFRLKPEAARLETGIYGLTQKLEAVGIDFSFSVSEECVSIEIKPLK